MEGAKSTYIKKINEGNLDLESAMLLQVETLKKQQEELKRIITAIGLVIVYFGVTRRYVK